MRKRILLLLLCSLFMECISCQETLMLPHNATSLTEEQKGMNPDRLAYPKSMKAKIEEEVSFECEPETGDLGPFSVSPTTKVMFSPGNLQYQASTKTWRFAEHQWDYIGEDNQNISDSYTGWIDLFGWGTGNNPTNTSLSNGDFSTFTEWGVNAISNGGNTANQWRTLTKDEWWYLLHDRPNAADLFCMVEVNGVIGVVLLPDESPHIIISSTDQNIVDHGSYYGIDEDGILLVLNDWSELEAAGAVFLPAACYRNCEGSVYDVGSGGNYWSSTPNSSQYAWRLYFGSDGVSMRNYGDRCHGYSVRLVR